MSIPVRRALYNKLATDSTLDGLLGTPPSGYQHNVYHASAARGAAFPYVIFSKSSGTPTYTFEPRAASPTWGTATVVSQAAFDNELWLVKGVGHDVGSDGVDIVASRVDWLLTKGTFTVSGANQLFLQRESDVEYAEEDGGETYYHSGALYRLIYSVT